MTPLRERMIKAMRMHGFSPRTHESYLAAVSGLARFTRRSPDTLTQGDLQRYFEHLTLERRLAPASVRLAYNGIRFLYLQVLAWPAVDLEAVSVKVVVPSGAPQPGLRGRPDGGRLVLPDAVLVAASGVLGQ
jgi:hypothetical protein